MTDFITQQVNSLANSKVSVGFLFACECAGVPCGGTPSVLNTPLLIAYACFVKKLVNFLLVS